jgi:peroxiredoxin
MADTLAVALADLTLPDADGQPVRLGDLWAKRPVVLVFLRHYG